LLKTQPSALYVSRSQKQTVDTTSLCGGSTVRYREHETPAEIRGSLEEAARIAEEWRKEKRERKASDSNNIQPIGKGVFGNIYDQFKGKVKEAVAFLKERKEGVAKGVFHRDEIGDIDIIWGVAHNDHNGKGLAHIIRKHIEKYGDFRDLDDALIR